LSQIQFIEAIAIYAPKGTDSWPCCNCRQSLNEFGLDTKVIGEHADGSIDSMTLGELIPHAFPMEVVLAAAHGQNWLSTVAQADAVNSKGGKRRKLIDAARQASTLSYSPYSDYPVGAAIQTFDDQIYTGCNIENCGYTQTIHAEQTAITKAISEGALHRALQAGLKQSEVFKSIALYSPKGTSWPSCNGRQALSEFGLKMQVIKEGKNGDIAQKSLKDLIPNAFPVETVLSSIRAARANTTK
jgi:cytidine deaminase